MRGLDRKIDIERKTVTSASSGQDVETWTKIVTRRSAAVRPLRGDERFTAEQFVASQQVEFLIRWSWDVADLSPLDRIVYPPTGDSPAIDEEIYDIIEVSEAGRREGLKIVAARRAEHA